MVFFFYDIKKKKSLNTSQILICKYYSYHFRKGSLNLSSSDKVLSNFFIFKMGKQSFDQENWLGVAFLVEMMVFWNCKSLNTL